MTPNFGRMRPVNRMSLGKDRIMLSKETEKVIRQSIYPGNGLVRQPYLSLAERSPQSGLLVADEIDRPPRRASAAVLDDPLVLVVSKPELAIQPKERLVCHHAAS